MAFFDDIRNYFPITQNDTPIQLIDNKFAVISRFKRICSLQTTQISFAYKDFKLIINGSDMKILFLSKGECFIKGKIKSIAFE